MPVDANSAQDGARQTGDARSSAQNERTVARPMLALDHGALRAVMLDLLGRPPFLAEHEHWVGRGMLELLDKLLNSAEFWEHWYREQLYFFLLIDNFEPRSERVVSIPEDLAQERLDVRGAIHRIALSPSFDRRNPGADTFVTVVLEQLGGMTVQKNPRELEIGKRLYDGQKGVFLNRSGSSQADVIDIVVHSREFAQFFLAREHARLLRGEPAPGELRGWAERFQREPRVYTDILRGWLLSPPYQARLAKDSALSNRLFVRSLFVDLMDRLPEADEAEPLREALDGLSDSTPLRCVLVRLLLESGRVTLPAKDTIDDPSAWISDLFRRWIGRHAREQELAAFVGAFHDPACRPETVVYALLSSPEYHVY
jgi:hypothetical protein